jgi:ribosomal protein L22
MTILKFTPQKAAGILSKTIKTAIYNAVNNFNLEKEDLVVKTVMIDQGPNLKRFRPMARGSANVYKKRTSHITVILETTGKPAVKQVAKVADTKKTVKATKTTKAKSKTVKAAKPKGQKTEVKVQTRKARKESTKAAK